MIPPRWREVRKGQQTMMVLDYYACGQIGDPNNFDFWHAFEHGWENDTFAVLDRFLDPGVGFVDVGAWVGTMTVYASRLCGQVVAFEPDPVAFAQLRAHALENRCTNVKAYEAAIGAVMEGGGFVPVRLGRKAAGAFGDSMTSAIYDGDAFEANTVLLDEAVALLDAPCGLVKMDVEGFEADILQHHRLRCPLWLSTHEYLVPDPAAYRAKLGRFLDAHRVADRSGDNLLVLP